MIDMNAVALTSGLCALIGIVFFTGFYLGSIQRKGIQHLKRGGKQ